MVNIIYTDEFEPITAIELDPAFVQLVHNNGVYHIHVRVDEENVIPLPIHSNRVLTPRGEFYNFLFVEPRFEELTLKITPVLLPGQMARFSGQHFGTT